jgi:hypothetical protein
VDEIELRLAVLERLVLERLALEPPGVLAQLAAVMRQGLAEADPDDRAVRMQALVMLHDALTRNDEFTVGSRMPGEPR